MDRRSRIYALSVALLLVTALFGLQAVTAAGGETPRGQVTTGPPVTTNGTTAPGTRNGTTAPGTDGRPQNGTLITVQSYGGFGQNNGKAIVVSDGRVVWEYSPANSRVFDAEMLENGHVLVSVATRVPGDECPAKYADPRFAGDHCVNNRVVELDYDTKRVVWQYSWYDHFIHFHEVHDADRLPNGETAIIDMGNNRAFTVNDQGEITWSWSAEEHMGKGSDFYEEYGGPNKTGPESDWTHMNDIDLLENGNFQLSIRNFDVVVEVDPETDDIVDVVGEPNDREGNDPVLHEQHNPMRLEDAGTVLVADSENDRIVEVNVSTDEIVWRYTGDERGLRWPRDADRLPGGTTLVTDSLNFRVIEVTADGEVVWEYVVKDDGKRGIPYEADRVALPEEHEGNASNGSTDYTTDPNGGDDDEGGVFSSLSTYRSYLLLYLPPWVEMPELLTLSAGVLVSLGILVDIGAYAAGRALRR